jgi:hypothetical protein
MGDSSPKSLVCDCGLVSVVKVAELFGFGKGISTYNQGELVVVVDASTTTRLLTALKSSF